MASGIKLSKTLSDRIKAEIKASGKTQREFAENTLHITPEHFSSVLSGKRRLTTEMLNCAADALGCSPDYLSGKIDFRTFSEAHWAQTVRSSQIGKCIADIFSLMGFCKVDTSSGEFLSLEIAMPQGCTENDVISHSEIVESFRKGYRRVTPHNIVTLVRESDNSKTYLRDDCLNALFADIEGYIRYRVNREFGN